LDPTHCAFLASLGEIVEQRLLRDHFQVVSPFAERFGAWEQRLVRGDGEIVSVISVACNLEQSESVPVEIWAGVSMGQNGPTLPSSAERVLIGELNLPIDGPEPFRVDLERILASAVWTMQGFPPERDIEMQTATSGDALASRA
jgi:hypothetical protein